MINLNFDDTNHVDNIYTETEADPVSAGMFGAIAINIHGLSNGTSYGAHFTEAYDDLSLNLIRFPDGELPDGFIVENGTGWKFQHNHLNNGSTAHSDQYQDFLDGNLVHAFSLSNDELIDDRLLGNGDLLEDSGILSFSESLQHAVETGSSFSLVLPEFQYLKPPVDRDPELDGVKTDFVAADHVEWDALVDDVAAFLEKLFLDGAYNNGSLPEDFIIELGNEDFFGWNTFHFNTDSPAELELAPDLDSYSAYAIGVLTAIQEFREAHPEIDFKVSMQASGGNYVGEIEQNFIDQDVTDLFGEIDIISVYHIGLDATLSSINTIEETAYIEDAIGAMQSLIAAASGGSSDAEVFMSAWGARSWDVPPVDPNDVDNPHQNHLLPAAGTALSLFSGMFEMGIDYAANWGIGSWDGLGTNATTEVNGVIFYAPYIEAYRQMAESLVGTHQIETTTMDGGREEDYNTYAYEDDAKAVIFLAANDYTGTAEVSLSNFGTIGYIWLERISIDANGNTVITREVVTDTGAGFTVTFNNAYEVVRVIVALDNPGDGYLHLWGSENGDTLNGGSTDDLLEGNDGNDTLSGGEGNDTLRGDDGADSLYGGFGRDTLYGGSENDLLFGYDGNDTLNGDTGNDVISGQKGHDILNGGHGNDTLFGGHGNDTLNGGVGIDYLRGENGNDTLDGGDGGDDLRGASGEDILNGGVGDDALYGGADSDELNGDDGNDTLFGGNGHDDLQGGTGIDWLSGGNGSDTVYGGAGADYLLGDAGNDVLFGDNGYDRINGGAGDDIMTGGSGNDRFVFDSGFGNDIITDFDVAGGDSIDLSSINGVNNLTDLTITMVGSDTVISIVGNSLDSITLEGVTVELSIDEFIF